MSAFAPNSGSVTFATECVRRIVRSRRLTVTDRRFVGALLAHSGVRCLLSRALDPAHFRRAASVCELPMSPSCEVGSGKTSVWLRHLHDTFRTRLRYLGDTGSGTCTTLCS
jgi:hypothetical protein